MKKKLLLIALPALMVLAGCSGRAVEPKAQDDGMIEDTLLHEEIFGALPEQNNNSKELAPRRALAPGQLYTPVLSFQRKTNGDGTFSVRFVATIEDSIVSATWYRSVHDIGGNTTGGKTKSDLDVQTVYRALNNNGDPVYATAETAIEDAGETPFSYYAVYCLLNIPSDKSDYYVNAYIEVYDGTNYKKSSAGVLNVADGSKRMTYSITGSNRDAGFINGVERANDSSGNKVAFESIAMNAGDKIEVFYINETDLTINKNSSLAVADGQSIPDFTLDSVIDTLTVNYKGTYKIYLNGDNDFYFQKKIWFQGPTGWGTDKQARIQFKNHEENWYPEFDMESSGTSGLFYWWGNYHDYADAQFYQRGSSNDDWTGYKGSSINNGKDLFTLPDWGAAGSWSVYGA